MLMMSGLDCHAAPLDQRQRLAFSSEGAMETLRWLRTQSGITGCVLLSTCNRTELYLNGEGETPWRLLCRGAGVPEADMEPYFTTRCGVDAARHLMEVTCGLHSQILGEDQIITQVRKAMELALEAKTADATLAALFRDAVTAGKRARTEVTVARGDASMGSRCRDILARELGGLEGRRILVIGNGQMGQLAARLLRQSGAAVWVTLRTYRHGDTTVPPGCGTVNYEDRMQAMEGLDAVVSATTSPHHTITYDALAAVTRKPRVLVDLAVPRDIAPECAEFVTYYDTDSLGSQGPGTPEELEAMHAIAEQELERFCQWQKRQAVAKKPPRFPMFIDLTGKRVVLVGGGTIAARRIASLRLFGCEIEVIAPELKCSAQGLIWHPRAYVPGDLQGACLAIAATDDRQVNHAVGQEAGQLGIPVSVADCEEECTFYFPAVCTGENVIAGVVSDGKDHHRTARAAKAIRRALEELE